MSVWRQYFLVDVNFFFFSNKNFTVEVPGTAEDEDKGDGGGK